MDVSSKSDVIVSHSSSLIAACHLDDDNNDDGMTEIHDIFINVDNPEKHTSTLDTYISFCVTTKVF